MPSSRNPQDFMSIENGPYPQGIGGGGGGSDATIGLLTHINNPTAAHWASAIGLQGYSWLEPDGNPTDVQSRMQMLADAIGSAALTAPPLSLSTNSSAITVAPMVFRNCVITADGGSAISITDWSQRIIFENCVFIGDAVADYTVDLDGSNVTLINCVVTAPRGNGLRSVDCTGEFINVTVVSGTDTAVASPTLVSIQNPVGFGARTLTVDRLLVILDTGAVRPTGSAITPCVDIGGTVSVKGLSVFYNDATLVETHMAETLLLRDGVSAHDVTVDFNDLPPRGAGAPVAANAGWGSTFPLVGVLGHVASGAHTDVVNLSIVRGQLPTTDAPRTLLSTRYGSVNNLQVDFDSSNTGLLMALIGMEGLSTISRCNMVAPEVKANNGMFWFVNGYNTITSLWVEGVTLEADAGIGYVNMTDGFYGSLTESHFQVESADGHSWIVCGPYSLVANNQCGYVGVATAPVVQMPGPATESRITGNLMGYNATTVPAVTQNADNSVVMGNVFERVAGSTAAVTTGGSNLVTANNVTI